MEPDVACFAEHVIKHYAKRKVITVSCYIHCDKKITLSMELPRECVISVEDESLNHAMVILGHGLKGIYSTYSRHNVFTEPELIIKPDNMTIGVKIGILSKEKWKKIKVT